MLRVEKEKVVQELVEKLQKAQGVYLADFRGLDVASITELRRKLKSANVEFLVVKNTLAKLAVDEAGIPDLKDSLVGPTSVALGYEDPVEPARVLVQFARKHERPTIRSGLLEGQLLTAEQVTGVASLPSKEELLARVATLAQSPLTGFVYRCQGLLQKLVAILNAYRQKREEEDVQEERVEEGETTQETGTVEVEPDQEEPSKDEGSSQEKTAEKETVSKEETDQNAEAKEDEASKDN